MSKSDMDLNKALTIMRSGEGRLRPIIDYYADTAKQPEMCQYINDPEIGTSVLYVLSEVPSVHAEVLQSIEQFLEDQAIGDRSKQWAEEILHNHEFTRRV